MRRVFTCKAALALLLMSGICAMAQDAPPQAEQDRILTAMRNYAEDYTANLPNFICQEVVQQYDAGRKPTKWHQGDTLTSKLVYNNGKEERTLLLVNNQSAAGNHRGWKRPLTTTGEFGEMMIGVLAPETDAKFTWAGWDDSRGKRLAKFDYAITLEHAIISLSLSDLSQARIASHGTLLSDPETGAIWRITSEADNIPKEVHTKSSTTVLDYGEVTINSNSYLLPVSAEVLMATDTSHIRNEMHFQAYRKFEAESTISFGDPATATPQH